MTKICKDESSCRKKIYIKHHKIVTHFFYIWFSTVATDKEVFEAIESEISWRNSITIDHDNTKSILVDIQSPDWKTLKEKP